LYTASTKAIVVVDITTQKSQGNWEGYKIQGTIPAGYRGWAVKKDRKTDTSEPLPVYEIIWMEHTARAISFQTIVNVNTAQSLQVYDGRDPEMIAGNFPVLDTMDLFRWRTLGGAGIAMRCDQNTPPSYEMVCCETWAGIAVGNLTTNLDDSTQPIAVLDWFGSQQDVQFPQSPAGFLRIGGTYPQSFPGALCIGALDAILGVYRPLVCDQVSQLQTVTLVNDLNAADDTAAITAGSQTATMFWPFSQNAPPFTSALNPFACSGTAGALMLAMWHNGAGSWILICGNLPCERLYLGSTIGALTDGGVFEVSLSAAFTPGVVVPTSPIFASNPMNYRSLSYVTVIVAESGFKPYTYIIVACQPTAVDVVVDTKLEGMDFKQQKRHIFAYLSDEADDWETVWSGVNCPPPALMANYEPSAEELARIKERQKQVMLEKGQEKV
jgi:hypothetical protein